VSLGIPDSPRVIVQGITGREAGMVVAQMSAYGTRVVAGVTPGKEGAQVDGVPVFDTVAAARAGTGGAPFDVSIVYVPPFAALDAVSEAVEAGIGLLLVVTENIPLHDAIRLHALARDAGASVIGPNSVGLIVPSRRIKLGAIGGDRPDRAFVPGRVGVISRSGGLTAEVGLQLRRRGLGVSTAVSIGGDALIGLEPADVAGALGDDDETEVIVYVGEPGTSMEERLADAIASGEITKPVVALILGEFMEDFPQGTVFGHAGAVIEKSQGSPLEKKRRLERAGAMVVESLDEAISHVESEVSS
jgi:succinyl-CoA synthetase alpha subunit